MGVSGYSSEVSGEYEIAVGTFFFFNTKRILGV